MIKDFYHKHHTIFIYCVGFLFAFITLLFASCVTSFIYVRPSGLPYYNDGAMFYLLGSNMLKGYTPYVDIFDHKGLYLFYYNMIGAYLGRTGVFFVQVLLLTFTFVFIYKAVELYSDKLLIILSALLFFGALYAFSGQTPNDSDMETPFNALMIYFYLKAIKNDDNKSFLFGNLFLGISTGIAINLRMSDAILPFSFVIYFAIRFIMKKDVKGILINAGIVLGAIIVMSIPPFVHAYFGGFLNDMVEAVYLNNFKYITTTGVRTDGNPTIAYIVIPLILVIYTLLIFFKRKELGKDLIIYVASTYVILAIFQLIIAFYPHYLIVLYPYISINLFILLTPYIGKEESKVRVPAFILSSLLMLGSLTFNPVMFKSSYYTDSINLKYIDENINEESRNGHTLIFGSPSIYMNANIKIGYGDFSCQFNHILFSERYSKENLLNYLDSSDSHYLICYKTSVSFAESLFVDLSSTYNLISPLEGSTIYIYRHI